MNDRLDDLASNTGGEGDDDFDLEAATVVHHVNEEKKSGDWVVISRVLKKTKKKKKKKDAADDKNKAKEVAAIVLPKEEMDCFYRDIAAVGACTETIRGATKRIGEINDEAFVTTTTSTRTSTAIAGESRLRQEFASLIENTNRQAMKVKKLLNKIEEENAKMENNEGADCAADLR